MQRFFDEENSLTWKKVGAHDLGVCDRERTLINFWASPDIKQFLSTNYPIGELFYGYLGGNASICYCYIDSKCSDKLVMEGSISQNQKQSILAGAVLLYNPFSSGDPMSIEAMVVNPKLVRKGIATKMVSSIKENPEFFGNELHTGKITTAVHKDNIASQRVFLKNKFKVMKRAEHMAVFDRCLIYYEYERGLEK